MVGYAYAGRHRSREAYQWSVEVSVYVAENQHRRGVGRALYTSLVECLRLQGFFHAYAGITLPNPASVGLHESLGFQPVGVYKDVGYKLGQWHTVGWLELIIARSISTGSAHWIDGCGGYSGMATGYRQRSGPAGPVSAG